MFIPQWGRKSREEERSAKGVTEKRNLRNQGNLDYLYKDVNICKTRIYNHLISVDALSPSSGMYNKYQQLWASRKNDNFAESGVDPNKSSVAIGISIDDKLHFLFGADLECNRKNQDADYEGCMQKCQRRKDVGWCNVCCESSIYGIHGKYDYVKIIHHSSNTGYCPSMWENKVSDNVVGVTTVFAKDGLPKRDMEVMYWDKCAKNGRYPPTQNGDIRSLF